MTNVIFSMNVTDTNLANPNPDTRIRQYVMDYAGVLNANQRNYLSQKLKAFEDSTSNQVIVYIVSSLDGESLEEYSHNIAEKNKIGQKGKDNGVLLLVAIDDRKIRIETGYGLEGALTDALSSSIIRNEIAPYFKSGKYFDGIDNGLNAIFLATKNEYKADKRTPAERGGLLAVIIVILFFIFLFIQFIKGIFGFGSVYSGTNRKGWFGSGGFWIFPPGGGSSSSGGGFFGGGGGFSGGGGSFGGGGASGSW